MTAPLHDLVVQHVAELLGAAPESVSRVTACVYDGRSAVYLQGSDAYDLVAAQPGAEVSDWYSNQREVRMRGEALDVIAIETRDQYAERAAS